jgi:hypothetical protein
MSVLSNNVKVKVHRVTIHVFAVSAAANIMTQKRTSLSLIALSRRVHYNEKYLTEKWKIVLGSAGFGASY